ncbi:MAG: hypothetical protein PQJ58_12310 [Spirochaetales bacterium]|nr:hypothetical protein [Spirochaetales bacterium]
MSSESKKFLLIQKVDILYNFTIHISYINTLIVTIQNVVTIKG